MCDAASKVKGGRIMRLFVGSDKFRPQSLKARTDGFLLVFVELVHNNELFFIRGNNEVAVYICRGFFLLEIYYVI